MWSPRNMNGKENKLREEETSLSLQLSLWKTWHTPKSPSWHSVRELNKISTWGQYGMGKERVSLFFLHSTLFFSSPLTRHPSYTLAIFIHTYIYVIATVYACAEGLLFYIFSFTEFMKKIVSLLLTRSRARCIFSLSWLRFSNISWPICSVEKEIWVRKGDFGCKYNLQKYHSGSGCRVHVQWVYIIYRTRVSYTWKICKKYLIHLPMYLRYD